jgi:S-methylmethionine-dependent homocysteine/selenocysteine methylase
MESLVAVELERRLQKSVETGRPIVTDGGMVREMIAVRSRFDPWIAQGTTLWSCLGQRIRSQLWCTRLLVDNPLAVYEVRGCPCSTAPADVPKCTLAFAASGSEVLSTATYQGHLSGIVSELQCTEAEAAAYLLSGVHIAARARDDHIALKPGSTRPLIGLSLGPYGATLCGKQEYQGTREFCHMCTLCFIPRRQLSSAFGSVDW